MFEGRVAIAGIDRDGREGAVAPDAELEGLAHRLRPEPPVERLDVGDPLAVDAHDHVARPEPRRMGRAGGRDAGDPDPALDPDRADAEPRPPGPGWPAGADDRLAHGPEQIDRDGEVAGL